MTSHPSDGHHQEVVKVEMSEANTTLTTPLPPPLKAVETCSVLLSIENLGCIELVAVVDVENTSQPISQDGVTHG